MSKQKRDNEYRGFQLEWTDKFAFVEGTDSLVCLICHAQIALIKRSYVKLQFYIRQ